MVKNSYRPISTCQHLLLEQNKKKFILSLVVHVEMLAGIELAGGGSTSLIDKQGEEKQKGIDTDLRGSAGRQVSYNPVVRDVTDEAQGLSAGPLHLNKNQWFYTSAALFALPFLYGTVYQMIVPNTPSSVYFDGCIVQSNLNETLCPSSSSACYASGTRLSFSECVACNGGASNLVDISPQQQGIFGVRLLAAFGTFLGWTVFFSLRVRFCRYARRSLALLAYGVYTIPQPLGKSKRLLLLMTVMMILLIALYVQLQLIGGTSLDNVLVGTVMTTAQQSGGGGGGGGGLALPTSQPVCLVYNAAGDVLVGEYAVQATFNTQKNPSTDAFGSPKPTWSQLCTMIAAAIALYAPIVYSVLSQYINPYSSIGLSDLVADGGKGVSKIISETIKYEIEMEQLSQGVIRFMKEYKVKVDLTCLQALVRMAKSEDRPAEEFMCELWGDNTAMVGAVLDACGSHVVERKESVG